MTTQTELPREVLKEAFMEGYTREREAFIAKGMDLAFQWAHATYCKGLGRPFSDIDPIREQLRTHLAALPSASLAQPEQPVPQGTVDELRKQMREVTEAAYKAPGKAVRMPELVATEGRKFMRGEPSLFDQLPFGEVQQIGSVLDASPTPPQAEQANEADELLRNLGLDPERYRTEAGFINHLKVKAAIRHPDQYPQLEQAEAAKPGAERAELLSKIEAAHADALVKYGNQNILTKDLFDVLTFVRAAILSADSKDCTRSHPHEEMGPTCELRTEIARLKNKIANMEADSKDAGEPVAWALSHKIGLEFSSRYPMCKSKAQAEEMARTHMGAVAVTPLYTRPQAADAQPLTDGQILTAAWVLNKLIAEASGDDEAGCWSLYANSMIIDAGTLLRAAHGVGTDGGTPNKSQNSGISDTSAQSVAGGDTDGGAA